MALVSAQEGRETSASTSNQQAPLLSVESNTTSLNSRSNQTRSGQRFFQLRRNSRSTRVIFMLGKISFIINESN